MKKITILIIFFVFMISTFFFLSFYKYYDDIKLPSYDEGIYVNSWDKKLNKNEVNELFLKLSKKYDIPLVRVNDNYKDNGKTKLIILYGQGDLKTLYIEPFSPEYHYRILNYKDEYLKQVNFVGDSFYTKKHIPDGLLKELDSNGISAVYFNQPLVFVFVDFVMSFSLIPTIIILLVIIFVAMLYNHISLLKAYSIQRIHGFNTRKLLSREIKKLSLVFIKISIVTNIMMIISLLIYNNLQQILNVEFSYLCYSLLFYIVLIMMYIISAIIVNKENYNISKYIKFEGVGNSFRYLPNIIKIVLTLTLVNVISSSVYNYQQLKVNLESEKYWVNNQDLYMTDLSINNAGDHKEKLESEEKTIHTLMNKIPDEKQLLAFSIPNTNKNKVKFDIDSAIFVNKTYIDRNNIKVKGNKKIDFSKLTILLPEDGFNNKNIQRLKKELNETINFYDEIKPIPNKEKYLNVNVLESENRFNLFNYQSMANLSNAVVTNPVLVIMPKELKPISFYSAASSQGLLLFKDYENVVKTIEQYHLNDEIQGVTNVYSIVLKDILRLKLKLVISVITSIFGIIVLGAVYLFTIGLYCDSEKKSIFVKSIHGFSFLKKHGFFIILSLVSTIVALFLVSYFDIIKFSISIFSSIILFELLSVMIFINRYEYHLLKDARRGETQ